MTTLDEFEILLNPGTEYFKTILKDMNRDEGWSFCDTDYDTWLTTYSKFWCYMARVKGTDTPVACVSLALDEHSEINGESLYSVGIYYCRPEFRGTGIATKLFDTVMALPPKDANVTLNGVLRMAPKYGSKYGFSHMPFLFTFTNFECKDVQKVTWNAGITTKDVLEVDWSVVNTYENTVNPRPHPRFLKKWTVNVGTHTRIAFNVDGKPVGLICIREDIAGNLSCGPFYADSKDASLALLSDTLGSIDLTKFGKVFMLYPKTNEDAEKIASEISGGKQIPNDFCWAQFTQKVVEVPQKKIYSIADCASGFL